MRIAVLIVFMLFHCNAVLAENQTFQDFVIMIDDEYCGQSSCSSTSNKRKTPNPFCRECSCQFECFVQQNCCPTTAFKYGGIYKEDTHTECISADLTGRITNSTQHYQLVSKCPANYPDDSWRRSCENVTDKTPLSLIPALGWSRAVNNVFFSNILCAGCNDMERVQPFSISATCKHSDIFLQAQSEIDVYHAAMNQSDCHLDVSLGIKSPDICFPYDKYLIRSCNESGLWRQRDDMIEAGCLLEIYKVPVKNRYYNIFCYLCNTDKDLNELIQEEPEIEKREIKPEAFLDGLPQTKAEKERELPPPNVCFEGDYFIDLKGRCFDISCTTGKVFNGIACESPIHSNVLGYEFCFELQTDVGEDIERGEAQLYLELLTIAELIREASGYEVTSITSFELQQWICNNSSSFKQQSLLSVVHTIPIKREWLFDLIADILTKVTFKQPHRCGQMNHNNCIVRFINGTNRTENNISGDAAIAEFSKHVLFVPFTRLDSCCQVLLEREDFLRDNNNQTLLIHNSKLNLSVDDYILNDNGTVTVCLSDVLTKYAVICNSQADSPIMQPDIPLSDDTDVNQAATASWMDQPFSPQVNLTADNYSATASSTVHYGSEGIIYTEINFIFSHCMLLILLY